MAITLTQAQAHLDAWMAADLAVSKGQAYTIGDRSLSRVHASEIRTQIQYWSRAVAGLQRIANGESKVSVKLANLSGK